MNKNFGKSKQKLDVKEENVIAEYEIKLVNVTNPSSRLTVSDDDGGSLTIVATSEGIYYKVRLYKTSIVSFRASLCGNGNDYMNTGFNYNRTVTKTSDTVLISFPTGDSTFYLDGYAIGANGITYETLPNAIHVHR